jgi:type I restriction enzyme S subunit
LVERYKQAVLAKAFSGELTAEWRISRPADETTNNLLATTPEPEKTRGGRSATETIIEGRAALSVNMSNRLLPLTWAWVPLSRVSRQETGHTPSRSHPEYWDGTIPWLSIPDANHCHGGEIKDTSQHITELGIQNSSARILPKETVCLSRTASVGYVVKMGQDMATSQDFVTWTCTGALDPDYLLFALLSEGDDIVRFGKGSTHKTIYFPEVRAFHISLAPFDEQKEIVRRIQSAFAWIDRIAAEQTNAAKLLGKLDQAVLAKAFRGELVPQDPNDEPASVLLDRIRQERAAQPKAKRQPRRSSTKPQE